MADEVMVRVDASTRRGAEATKLVPGDTWEDEDGDGMPDIWNQRMPGVSMSMAIIALFPLVFAAHAGLDVLRAGASAAGGWAYGHGVIAAILGGATVVFASYGVNARRGAWAKLARNLALVELAMAIGVIAVIAFTR